VGCLASRIEGNLLAATQEIEALYLLYGEKKITAQQISDAVADASRYDVFQLMDSVLANKLPKALKILRILQAEAIAPPIVLWAIVRDLRILVKINWALASGQKLDQALKTAQVWDKRRPLVTHAVQRLSLQHLETALTLCAQADRQSKGLETGDVWETLLKLCLSLASVQLRGTQLTGHL